MIISIDFDKTWTADPPLWKHFSRIVKQRGHQVILVTNRLGMKRDVRDLAGVRLHVDEIVFAGPGPKRDAARLRGYDPDVWIDDNPSTVDYGL